MATGVWSSQEVDLDLVIHSLLYLFFKPLGGRSGSLLHGGRFGVAIPGGPVWVTAAGRPVRVAAPQV